MITTIVTTTTTTTILMITKIASTTKIPTISITITMTTISEGHVFTMSQEV